MKFRRSKFSVWKLASYLSCMWSSSPNFIANRVAHIDPRSVLIGRWKGLHIAGLSWKSQYNHLVHGAKVRLSDGSGRNNVMALKAFVGSNAPPAAEYHDSDFSWEDHRDSIINIQDHHREDLEEIDAALFDKHRSVIQNSETEDMCWEDFHARDNATAKFYKERRYLLREFPQLLEEDPPQHIAEIGCGCGSSILPILKANATCRATASDLSPTAIAMLDQSVRQAGIASSRIQTFACDATDATASDRFKDLQADCLLLIFTLAALSPDDMGKMLANCHKALKPGGLLLFRDHGVLDITHLRLPAHRKVEHRLYQRGDGTLCYFFTPAELQIRMKAAGFRSEECKYACVQLKNRKQDLQMRRVFVHGVFVRQ